MVQYLVGGLFGGMVALTLSVAGGSLPLLGIPTIMATGAYLELEAKDRCTALGQRPATAARGEVKWERDPSRVWIGRVRCVD
jgi:hypothetical protein